MAALDLTPFDPLVEEHLRAKLQQYGYHMWQCAVSRQLRADVKVTDYCDCGWQEIARAIVDEEGSGT